MVHQLNQNKPARTSMVIHAFCAAITVIPIMQISSAAFIVIFSFLTPYSITTALGEREIKKDR